MLAKLSSLRAGDTLRRLLRDRRGIAAVEFAFIAPLLLSMYFVTLEVGLGIETNKKVGRTGSMVADLVTQHIDIGKTELESIMKIGESIIQPYSRTKPKITVTAIDITSNPGSQVQVLWSRKMDNGVFSRAQSPGTVVTVPASLNIPGSFLIRVESELKYKPLITWTAGQKASLGLAAAFDEINMREVYYLRPRMTNKIGCGDC
jgi:Flp pilus assembly protein TadG